MALWLTAQRTIYVVVRGEKWPGLVGSGVACVFSYCDGRVEWGWQVSGCLLPLGRPLPPPSLGRREGTGCTGVGVGTRFLHVELLYVVLFFKISEGITYQKDLFSFYFKPPSAGCGSQASVNPRLVFCLVCQESSKIHPNASLTGADDAAQAWDLLLPLGGQRRPGSWRGRTEDVWQVRGLFFHKVGGMVKWLPPPQKNN